ncbi:sulfatase family protein [Demequina aurantiaca]|uniref:sulfatase family protein n=1 Tax=Demequina aurantiaca TaxID=676200 RepID=UPI00078135AF|nr:sulfatase [Demequina aurantiaca]
MHMRTRAVPPDEVGLLAQYFREAGYYTANSFFTDFQMEIPPTAYDDLSGGAHWRNRPDKDQPFFMAHHGFVTHESQIYLDDEAFFKATSHVADEDRHDPDSITLPPYYPDTEVFRKSWARYLDLITEMDHEVGTFLEQLEEDGLADNTIVVFWSDHGLGMPRAKRWATESGLREPLIMRWPGKLEAGTSRPEVMQMIDLAPTMLRAAGIEIPAHMHGTPLFDDEGTDLPAARYAFGGRDRMDEQLDTVRTVRDEQFRYVRHLHPDRPHMTHCDYPDKLATWGEMRRLTFEEAGQLGEGEVPDKLTPLQRSYVSSAKEPEELYNIRNDPHETVNLATDPAHAETLDRLRGALDEWSATYPDLGLMPEDELIEMWRPGGKRQLTAEPVVSVEDGVLTATCETPGATVGWTTEPPREPLPKPTNFMEMMAQAQIKGRAWNLLTAPVELEGRGQVYVGAFRIGFEPSPEVTLGADQGTLVS